MQSYDWLNTLLWLILVLWVLINANLRKNNVVGWTVLALLTGPFVIPFVTDRPNGATHDRHNGATWKWRF